MERYDRLRKLQAAWKYRKTLTELKLEGNARAAVAVENSIEDVEKRMSGTDPNQIYYHDFNMQHLLSKSREKASLNKSRGMLNVAHYQEDLNTRRCEKLEHTLKAAIDQRRDDAQLLEILENLLIQRDN
jgi:hypothetical protein